MSALMHVWSVVTQWSVSGQLSLSLSVCFSGADGGSVGAGVCRTDHPECLFTITLRHRAKDIQRKSQCLGVTRGLTFVDDPVVDDIW